MPGVRIRRDIRLHGEMGHSQHHAFKRHHCRVDRLISAWLTGRGTGIDDKTLANKVSVIEDAIKVSRPDIKRPH